MNEYATELGGKNSRISRIDDRQAVLEEEGLRDLVMAIITVSVVGEWKVVSS